MAAAGLAGGVWDVPTVGIVHHKTPDSELAAAADGLWPHRRPEGDVHHVWRWADILRILKDAVGLVGENGRPLALMGSTRGVIQLSGTPYYRLDYFEIEPDLRGGVFGAFALAIAATHALEEGGKGMVLTAFPVEPLAAFYRKAGGVDGAPRGWSYPKELLPFTYTEAALERLRGAADGVRES